MKLYEQRVRGQSQQDQDWLEAEREIGKDQAEHGKATRMFLVRPMSAERNPRRSI